MECYLIERWLDGGREAIAVFSSENDAKAYILKDKASYSKRTQAFVDYEITELPHNPALNAR